MKKNIFIVGLLLIIFTLSGCSSPQASTPKENNLTKEGQITFERIKYEDLNSEIQTNIDAKKKKNGHMLIKTESNDSYLVVFSGEKNSGGYRIEITEVINDKGTTTVKVIETAPAKDMMSITVMTYPMDIIKLKGITTNIDIINTTIDKTTDQNPTNDNFKTVGEIIAFEKESVHVLTGDIAEIFNVDSEKTKDFYLGEIVGVKKIGTNKFELVAFKDTDFTIRHTNMGHIISTVSGPIKEIKDKKFIVSTNDEDIAFESYDELELEKGIDVTVDYIELETGSDKKTLIAVYNENSKLNLTIKNIRRSENGLMILDTEDENNVPYEVNASGVVNFNYSDLNENDKITVYPETIREIFPAQIDAKMIIKQ